MSDDHASSAVSAYGGEVAKVARTPNIDRLAEEGARLDNVFVTNSICTPSRACILTGQYSQRNGVYTLSDKLDPERNNVAKLLRRAGYQTAIIGKWHLKTKPSGFDYWNVLPGQGKYHNPVLREAPDHEEKQYEGHSTDVITDLALKWLGGRETEKPFFLMCHYKATHANWDPAERFKELYEDTSFPYPVNITDNYKDRSNAASIATGKLEYMLGRKHLAGHTPEELKSFGHRDEIRHYVYQAYMKQYMRCVAGVDENVGRLLQYLDKNGLTENTVVIYTSDQGHFNGEHGYYDKRFIYEESLRMPFLIRYPKEIQSGTVNKDITINADFAPLFLDYAGASANAEMQGRSFRANLTGNTPSDWRDAMYYRYWMHLAHHGVPAHYGIRTDRYKLIFHYGLPLDAAGAKPDPTPPEWEMFDLEKDPLEMRNVYDDPAYAETAASLKEKLDALKTDLGDEDQGYLEMMKIRKEHWD